MDSQLASPPNAVARIAAFAAASGHRPPGASARHLAYRALLDTVAVAIAGGREPATEIVGRYVAGLAGAGPASAWNSGVALPAETAALVNGVAAHVLDYDDVMTPMRAHVSATLVPALMALAPASGADGRRYAAAYIAGFEVMARFASAMALPHYSKGWHSTSALGILGTTTACAVLLGLNAEQAGHALGLAVAQASGTRENFGAMAKSFQSAACAAAAVRSALLAQLGFTAAPSAIDGRYGFMRLYGENEDLAPSLAGLGEEPLRLEAVGIDVKKYPCCYALHRALDGTFDLMRDERLAAGEVERVDVLTSAGGMQALIAGLPRDGLQGKFSMEYAVAAALVDGRTTFASFADPAVRRPEVVALMARVSLREAEGSILPRWTELRFTLQGGRTLERRVLTARGDAAAPLSDEELVRKAADCFVFGGARAEAAHILAERVFDLDDRKLAELIPALPPKDTQSLAVVTA